MWNWWSAHCDDRIKEELNFMKTEDLKSPQLSLLWSNCKLTPYPRSCVRAPGACCTRRCPAPARLPPRRHRRTLRRHCTRRQWTCSTWGRGRRKVTYATSNFSTKKAKSGVCCLLSSQPPPTWEWRCRRESPRAASRPTWRPRRRCRCGGLALVTSPQIAEGEFLFSLQSMILLGMNYGRQIFEIWEMRPKASQKI